MQAAQKLGIVYIGKAGGKHKYSLLDEKDIHLVKKFRFEAKVDVNKDGNGATIFAYAFDLSREEASGCYFHEYIWEKHCGGVAPGFQVCHKNGVTVDNRLNNLCVKPSQSGVSTKSSNHVESFSVNTNRNNCASEPREDQRLYWMAVSRLPPFEAEHEMTPYHFMSVIIRHAAKLKLSCESSVFVDSVSMFDTVGPYVKR
ncbi:Zinc finger MYND domain-containing protein 19 [Acropora cervicornis]|uniref:Zinc finger MYND domain-containing protein 19 n=1 Tax=Acropora cervicornis TaxID=6130 RepID=A0AAD9QTJ9_ACRCE|nr:Zinc finger MYND domain-containing protein 19 [Acropora cervicornis]